MSYRAIYAYEWDVAERGVEKFVGEAVGLGLDTVTFAGAYHAGKFIRPKGRAKVHFPEDGTIYFRADTARYGRIRPVENSGLETRDTLRALCGTGGIAVNAWMVLLHNTRLGSRHPEASVENAFGDRYVYSLCPSNPDVREFAVALCRDVTENYPVTGLSLETPGFLPYAHGFHHEFALMRQNRWFDAQMGLCFCEACRGAAKEAGVDDVEGLRARIRRDVEAYLAEDVDFPDDMAEAIWLADIQTDGALPAFLRFRCEQVTSLVAEIRRAVRRDAAVAVIPSVARPTAGSWYEGSDLPSLAQAAGIIEACFYEPGAARIRADVFDVKRRLGGKGKLRGILRPAFPDLPTRGEVVGAAAALREAGITEIAFYNYGHLRQASLGWIADALDAFGG